jgi:hypothetical protein
VPDECWERDLKRYRATAIGERERERERVARGGVNECSQQENEKEKNGAENGR